MTYPTFSDFKKIITSVDLEEILYLHVIEGTPYIFKDNPEKYQLFRKLVSSTLDVPMKNIIIVGSARIGFSLSPYHFGMPFRKTSDVDTVVVSAQLFDMTWLELLRLERKWYELTEEEREFVKRHIEHVYWGNIRPDKLPVTTRISKLWLETFGEVIKTEEFATKRVNAFLFRTWWQVQSFYMRSLRILRGELSES